MSRYFKKAELKQKKWNPGELKSYLAEQRALKIAREGNAEHIKMLAFRRLHDEYVKRIWRLTCNAHVKKVAEDVEAFSPFSPINPQYEEQLKQHGVLVVEK